MFWLSGSYSIFSVRNLNRNNIIYAEKLVWFFPLTYFIFWSLCEEKYLRDIFVKLFCNLLHFLIVVRGGTDPELANMAVQWIILKPGRLLPLNFVQFVIWTIVGLKFRWICWSCLVERQNTSLHTERWHELTAGRKPLLKIYQI